MESDSIAHNRERWNVLSAAGVEYRHSLQTIVNNSLDAGFSILGLWESVGTEADPEPGSFEHFRTIAPPWLVIWLERV
jgi:hypothetical protein